jgi:acetylglutamate kinase
LLDPEHDSKIIYELQAEQFNDYKQKGIISTGMLPKLENGFRAKRNGVKEVLITNTENLSTGRGTRLV